MICLSAEQKQARHLKRYWRLFLQSRKNLSTNFITKDVILIALLIRLEILIYYMPMLAYDQELGIAYNFIQSLKFAYFTTFFQLLKLRPDGVSHYPMLSGFSTL